MKTVLTLYILFNISSIHCLENDWISFYKPGIIDNHRNIDNILKTSDHLLVSGIFYQTLSENPFSKTFILFQNGKILNLLLWAKE